MMFSPVLADEWNVLLICHGQFYIRHGFQAGQPLCEAVVAGALDCGECQVAGGGRPLQFIMTVTPMLPSTKERHAQNEYNNAG
jgi:hypothetical protein